MKYTVTVAREDNTVIDVKHVDTDDYNILSGSCYATLRDQMGGIASIIFNDAMARIKELR